MPSLRYVFLISVCCTMLASAQPQGYYARSSFGMASPGSLKYGLYGFDNPALLSTVTQPDLLVTWTKFNATWKDSHRWGLFTGAEGIGFGMMQEKQGTATVTDYNLAFATGDQGFSLGMAYGWSTGDKTAFNHGKLWTLGALYRPNQYLSLGIITYLPAGENNEGVVDLALRPFGNEKLALFGDVSVRRNRPAGENKWSAGIAAEAFPGIRLAGRYFQNKDVTVGIQLELGTVGVSARQMRDKASGSNYPVYGIRLGAYDRNSLQQLQEPSAYYSLNMNGPLNYRRFKYFDRSNTLSGILGNLDAALTDPAVKGVAINLSGMAANKELIWELREKLLQLKAAGKKIVVYIDNSDIETYHLASAADKIFMDPLSMLMLNGYVLGRTYLKGTLEKLGIGYDEWRFFKYKSAVETFSRDAMSDADREQRKRLADEWYRITKADIVSSGRVSAEQFEQLVNKEVACNPQQAKKAGLIDEIGRWDAVEKFLEDEKSSLANASVLAANRLPKDNRWGTKPVIAVIYALGACAMDEGINARSLVNDVNAAVQNPGVKAIVLRVDSPGGDALASDVIAEALKKAKGKKPVIISQGSVAASGGYWLSMYGDTIVAAPGTITGSIGVIGGWFYNKEFNKMLGVSTDHVKAGEHADLGFGAVLPLLNMGFPDRNLTPDERVVMEGVIKNFYTGFVAKVAAGRNRPDSVIAEVAQGRVWSGADGLNRGLVDVLGGLETAVTIAAEKAGLKKGEYDLKESPEPGLFDAGMFMPRLIGVASVQDENSTLSRLRFRLQYNGKPLYMAPLDDDYLWDIPQQ